MTTETTHTLLMTHREYIALTLFLSDRKALWLRTAKDAGVDRPDRLLHALREARKTI